MGRFMVKEAGAIFVAALMLFALMGAGVYLPWFVAIAEAVK